MEEIKGTSFHRNTCSVLSTLVLHDAVSGHFEHTAVWESPQKANAVPVVSFKIKEIPQLMSVAHCLPVPMCLIHGHKFFPNIVGAAN